MDDSIISLKDFSLSIAELRVLKNINLDIYSGDAVVLYGPRNSGKSSLLRSFVHLNEEMFNNVNGTGGIFFEGQNVQDMSKKTLRSSITYTDTTFVDNLNFFNLKELLNISLGMSLKDINKDHYKILDLLHISHIFSDVDNLKKYFYLENWSIAEKISLIIFISLIKNPKVFMFDSILDHLDDFLLKEVKEILYNIKGERTLIISTRNFSLFSDIAEKVILIESGEIKYKGSKGNFILNFV